MVRIGLVDLDTSHPAAWLPILRKQPGVEVVAVCDGGAVHDPGYARTFAEEHEIERATGSPEEMVDHVDAAIIHSCNWDVHLERAAPFIRAGKPVFLDKPVVGNLNDIQRLREWVKAGADIIGGSALRYVNEVRDFSAKHPPESVYTIFATCPNDLFNYGIHGYEMILGAMGGGIESARHLGGKDVSLIQLTFADGRQGLLQLQTPAGRFHFTASTRDGIESVAVQGGASLYAPMIESIAAHFTGERSFPVSAEEMLEPCLAALAAKASMETRGPVRLDELHANQVSYDGHAFEKEYRASRRGAVAG